MNVAKHVGRKLGKRYLTKLLGKTKAKGVAMMISLCQCLTKPLCNNQIHAPTCDRRTLSQVI